MTVPTSLFAAFLKIAASAMFREPQSPSDEAQQQPAGDDRQNYAAQFSSGCGCRLSGQCDPGSSGGDLGKLRIRGHDSPIQQQAGGFFREHGLI